ncbi:hypothetical protein AVEN_133538-1 [Araneus ventricosus]|uniref:Uncharacterized protein n=1 Tax=Araneus ventricosus TaxID=182803 RepID=A0A4Y2W9U0_ARAVE|nr:hypothetical protein AVEN_133538-1 [Araneus ventricosus]
MSYERIVSQFLEKTQKPFFSTGNEYSLCYSTELRKYNLKKISKVKTGLGQLKIMKIAVIIFAIFVFKVNSISADDSLTSYVTELKDILCAAGNLTSM